MSDGATFLISLLCAGGLMGICRFFRRFFIVRRIKNHRYKQSQNIRFLQVRVPKNAVARSSDIEASDHVSTMKDNIALMNQVYKNFYAISDTKRLKRKLGDNYVSMELVVENEVIKFFVGVPEDHLLTVQKMIASFYPGALVEITSQPKLLEAGKFMAGGEFTLTKDSVYPIKTYESFEADPMDSLLSAFSRVGKQEKVCFQILAEPLSEKWLKDMRKQGEKIKKNERSGFSKFLHDLFTSEKKREEEKQKGEEKNKHNFSQQQLSDFDKKMDDELFKVKIKAIATSPEKDRPKKMLDDIARLCNQYNYLGLNTLKFEKVKNADLDLFARNFVERIFYTQKVFLNKIIHPAKNNVLNIKELSSLIHFPHGRFNQNPRIARQKFKIVPAPDDIPSEGMVVGYVGAIDDPHTVYLKEEDNTELMNELKDNAGFAGIGAVIEKQENYVVISEVLKNSPAARAGLLPLDRIYMVEDQTLEDLSATEVVQLIRGEKGTEVNLFIEREGKKGEENKRFLVTIVRDDVSIPSVTSEVIEKDGKNLLYLEVSLISNKTTALLLEEVRDALETAEKIDGIILDLRGNSGGYLEEAVKLLGHFFPRDTLLVKSKYKAYEDIDHVSKGRGELGNYPIVILVDQLTASAGEIIALKFQEEGKTIIGMQTFGKGSIQAVEDFKDGSSLKYTVGKWYSPSDVNIDKEGITPDIEVERDYEKYKEDGTDNQLETAKEELLKLIK